MHITRRTRLALALVAVQLLSSGTHLVAKGALLLSSPLTVALLRFVASSIALLALQRVQGTREAVARRDWPAFLVLGLLVVPLNQGCFLFGLSRSTPSHAALLYALTPLVVLLFAGRLLRERGLVAKSIGILVALLGVLVILFERGLRHELSMLSGDLMILVAVLAWSLYSVLSKRLLARYDPMTVTTWSIVSGTVLSLPALAIPGAIPPLGTIPSGFWGALIYLSIGTTVVAYPLWSYALKNMDASKVAITTNTQPIVTGILSWFLFREQFTAGFIAGAVLILAGVTWVESRRGTVTPEVARAAEGAA